MAIYICDPNILQEFVTFALIQGMRMTIEGHHRRTPNGGIPREIVMAETNT